MRSLAIQQIVFIPLIHNASILEIIPTSQLLKRILHSKACSGNYLNCVYEYSLVNTIQIHLKECQSSPRIEVIKSEVQKILHVNSPSEVSILGEQRINRGGQIGSQKSSILSLRQ